MKKSQSAGGVVINPDGEILIVNQKNTSWSLPKGHVHEQEDLLEAAKREIDEESGVTELRMHTYLGSFSRLAPDPDDERKEEYKTLHFFLFSTEQVSLAPKDPNNPEARWVKKEDVEDYLFHPEDKRFFREVVIPHINKST